MPNRAFSGAPAIQHQKLRPGTNELAQSLDSQRGKRRQLSERVREHSAPAATPHLPICGGGIAPGIFLPSLPARAGSPVRDCARPGGPRTYRQGARSPSAPRGPRTTCSASGACREARDRILVILRSLYLVRSFNRFHDVCCTIAYSHRTALTNL